MSSAQPPSADVWKSADLVRTFLEGVRGGIPYAENQIEIMVRLVQSSGRSVSRFLDLGSGAGTLAAALQARFPNAEAVLVDFSRPMLDLAKKTVTSPPNYLVQADFNDREWTTSVRELAPFDAIVSGYAIHHSPDETKKAIFRDVFALLAPGGMFVNVEHVKPATSWVGSINDELFIESIHAHHLRLGTGKTREDVAAEFVYRPDKQANILAPMKDQCDWLQAIGFEDVDCYFKVFELAVFGGRKPG